MISRWIPQWSVHCVTEIRNGQGRNLKLIAYARPSLNPFSPATGNCRPTRAARACASVWLRAMWFHYWIYGLVMLVPGVSRNEFIDSSSTERKRVKETWSFLGTLNWSRYDVATRRITILCSNFRDLNNDRDHLFCFYRLGPTFWQDIRRKGDMGEVCEWLFQMSVEMGIGREGQSCH